MDQKRCPRAVSSSALRTLPPGTLVNAIRSALDFVILPDCFASFLSLATPDEMQRGPQSSAPAALVKSANATRVFLDGRRTGSHYLAKRSHDYSDGTDREYSSPFEVA